MGQQTNMAPWMTSLFGCMEDITSCCMGSFCPCLQYAEVNDIVEEGSYAKACLLMWCCQACTICCIAPGRRGTIRKAMPDELDEEPCGDCLVWVCCPSCASCQEFRELKLQRSLSSNAEFMSVKNSGGSAPA